MGWDAGVRADGGGRAPPQSAFHIIQFTTLQKVTSDLLLPCPTLTHAESPGANDSRRGFPVHSSITVASRQERHRTVHMGFQTQTKSQL
jgi:hypothetical protein